MALKGLTSRTNTKQHPTKETRRKKISIKEKLNTQNRSEGQENKVVLSDKNKGLVGRPEKLVGVSSFTQQSLQRLQLYTITCAEVTSIFQRSQFPRTFMAVRSEETVMADR
ncbi:hypothetical protein E2C01_082377 [Portunus trituberculatus]|uniref:Uncharacterized protein n=1 Tax=Portunus trituberculatus TaxID=210409 RepID=A0A5B7J4S5_PORTR|nr:hypothetical protein [Portunus trituberculatus]